MQKLTLDQAAKELGIKRESVYKRVRRGTLPHTKGLDGRMYVYMDVEEEAEKKAGAQQPEDSGQNPRRSWVEYVAAGTGVIALLGGLTYGLGLLALWAPLWRAYTHDASTAWYGASVVPRTVVAGLGMGSLVAYPTLFAAFGLFVMVVAARVAYSARKRWGRKTEFILVELISLGFLVVLVWDLATTRFFSFPPFSWQVSMAIGAAFFVSWNLLFVLLAVSIIWWRRRNSAASSEGLDKVDATESSHNGDSDDTVTGTALSMRSILLSGPTRWSWPVLLVALAYISAGANVTLYNPALPEVEISGVKDMEGALLTHTDGFWYVFDVSGKNKGELIALRDDRVETVTLISKDSKAE